jgi:hypothetical protein
MVFGITNSLELNIRSAFKVNFESFLFPPETLDLDVYFMNERTMQSTHQLTNAQNKTYFMTSIKLLHVVAPWWILKE